MEAFLECVMEFEGTKGFLNTRKSGRTWSVATVSLHLTVLNRFYVSLGQKRLFLAQNCADLGGHLTIWRLCPGAPLASFWLKDG